MNNFKKLNFTQLLSLNYFTKHYFSNSSSIIMSDNSNLATLAGGCFWGVEHYFKKEFGSKLLKTSTGYANGDTDKPSYRQVCSGSSGYAEAVQLEFDPSKVSYEELVTFFWRIHDPTTLNR
jgi:peptide-methionine (S)-S-oxide reductase